MKLANNKYKNILDDQIKQKRSKSEDVLQFVEPRSKSMQEIMEDGKLNGSETFIRNK